MNAMLTAQVVWEEHASELEWVPCREADGAEHHELSPVACALATASNAARTAADRWSLMAMEPECERARYGKMMCLVVLWLWPAMRCKNRMM